MGRRPHAQDFDAREHLLDVAVGLFAERGIANTTVAQIAAASGVTSAMVHYWFQTREKLLDALFEEKLLVAFDSVWQPADPAHDDPLALTQGIVARLFDVTTRMPWLPSLWLREVINEGGLLRERALAHLPAHKLAGFAQNIARGCASGQLNAQLEPLLLFNSVLGLVMLPQATAKIWQRLDPHASFERATLERHVVALLTHGISGGPAPTPPAASRRAKRPAR
ncbi:TetR/AcrR family transcriptional regulator [Paraburkholderia sp. MMS20-SJTR3]|uniref:TetR/AcrR family transcriptional regulator n=1 Tax=Paraburkholderia sejongensis TaxID=2886946 RepID=A0ABS8K157_9BURK|nr:TetR/AcrR family transcriptional regulator [Paraburkholderia sp. MMS20-SJTR3]MCC8395896.1 TetR/AcrR family transcriptional regulator [Paraburkholderia sp. MMS20-SJTR3]